MIALASRRRAAFHASPRAIGAVLLITALASLAVARSGGDDARTVDATDADTIAAFAAGIERLGADGGQIVSEGMKPGVADIAERTLPDEVLVRMATGWVASMEDVRREVAALDAPGVLAPVAAMFERALAAYVHTAQTLLDAARADGIERSELVDRAVVLGGDADELYDDAIDALARVANGRISR